MSSAVFALSVNVAIAGLFAATFLALALSKDAPRSSMWFAAAYFFGMLTPASELAIRFTSTPGIFAVASYGAFVLAFLMTAIALARHNDQIVPWIVIASMCVASVCLRAMIWDGLRNSIYYELTYQLPFAATTLLCSLIAQRSIPKARINRTIFIVFAIVSAHFLLKAFAAVWFGSGENAQAYAASTYALISQSVTAVLLTAVGLLLLFSVFERMLSTANAASQVDVLSGLFNRRGFDVAAEAIIRRTSTKPFKHVSLLLFDLDHFKRINDTYGHAIGDTVIRRFSETLLANCPSRSVCSRIGGEEFVVLLENCNPAMARMFAETVRAQFEAGGIAGIVARTSVGISSSDAGTSLESLLGEADAALYDAKQSGRNCVRSFLAHDNMLAKVGSAGV